MNAVRLASALRIRCGELGLLLREGARPPMLRWQRSPLSTSPRHRSDVGSIAVFLGFATAQATASLLGWGLGRRFRSLPADKRALFWSRLKKTKWRYISAAGALGISIGSVIVYNVWQDSKAEGRSKWKKPLRIFPSSWMQAIADWEAYVIGSAYNDNIVPASHKAYPSLISLYSHILQANADIEEITNREWTISIVTNAPFDSFSVPGRDHIVLTAQSLAKAENITQIAYLISHQIGHVITGDWAAKAEKDVIFTAAWTPVTFLTFFCVPSFLIATAISAFTSSVAHALVSKLADTSEEDADLISMLLMARACLDIRECGVFHEAAALHKVEYPPSTFTEVMLWLYRLGKTSSEHRAAYIEHLMPLFLSVREQRACGPLPPIHPRKRLEPLRERLELLHKKSELPAASDSKRT